MDQEKFTEVVDDMIKKIRDTIVVKGEEYMRDNDRLSNFKQAAGIRRGETPEGALLGMLMKHWVSIADHVDDIADGNLAPMKIWNEKLVDNIIYSILLKAMVFERADSHIELLKE